MTTSRAVLRNIKSSPQKLNLVAAMIRGKHAADAMSTLEFCRKKVAKPVYDTLMSAYANAEENHGLDGMSLYVKEAYVGKGMLLKRFHARARGRGARVIKHYANLTIVLEERESA